MPDFLAYYITALRKDLNTYSDARLKQYGLTDGLFYYIIYIGKNPGCSLSEAARFLKADNGHVTRCIGKLEQLGYAVRTRDTTDHRHFHLALTAQGEDIFKELHTLLYDWDQTVCKNLSGSQREQLLELLQLVTDNREACKEGTEPCTRP